MTQEETKAKCDNLIEKFTNYDTHEYFNAAPIERAIEAVKYSIEVLEGNIDDAHFIGMTKKTISEQEQILNELKSRL